jgi:hypothetical protein
MKRVYFLLLAIPVLLSVNGIISCNSSSKTSTSTPFKLNLEKGRGYDYEMIMDLDTKVAGQTSAVTITSAYSMNVASIENGIRSIETAYKSMRMNMQVMGMNFDIDSDKPIDNNETDPTKNPLGVMNRVVSGIVGKKFTIKVDEEGKVLEVVGFERMMTDMVDSMHLPEEAREKAVASMRDQFSDQNLKDQFAQIFNIFPNKAIKVGDTWEKSYVTGGKMASKNTTTYKVKDIEGNNISLVTNSVISSPTEGGQQITGTTTGNLIVDSKTGLMISGDMDQDMTMSTQGQKVDIKGKMKIKGKAN